MSREISPGIRVLIVDSVTGWGIGPRESEAAARRTDAEDAAQLYRVLEERVAPAYAAPDAWAHIMRSTIAVNASFFDTHRTLIADLGVPRTLVRQIAVRERLELDRRDRR